MALFMEGLQVASSLRLFLLKPPTPFPHPQGNGDNTVCPAVCASEAYLFHPGGTVLVTRASSCTFGVSRSSTLFLYSNSSQNPLQGQPVTMIGSGGIGIASLMCCYKDHRV